MSESPKAVFLSYASQDADAARRIAQALRAEGIEVWFDESALAGGEAWDASIRRQIRDCALFVAIVSANTQARKEGYFRLEWKLADERSQLIAEGTPFVLPVIVDGTKERDALVPKSFLVVQWTWLPHGEVPPAFVARVQRLLGVGSPPSSVTTAQAGTATGSPIAPERTLEREIHAAAQPRVSRRWAIALLWALSVLVAIGMGAWLARQPERAGTAEPRHTELALPESAPVAFMGPAPNGIWQRAVAISRDGRTVAYIALKGETTSLVARYLDTGGAREFPGTEGAYFPFFSPDGQWIAYFAKGELRKVAVGGGTPSTLATDIHAPAGASWKTTDRILVSRSEGGRPMWVSSGGHSTSAVNNPEVRENYQLKASDLEILPSEEWALSAFGGFLQALSLKGSGVYWLSKEGPVRAREAKPTEVLRGWSPRYLKEGYLVFMSGQGTELQAIRFDPAKVRPSGAPFSVMEGVRRELRYTAGQFALSEQGTFVYAPGVDLELTELVWVNQHGAREKVAVPAGIYSSLSLGRDGMAALYRKKPTGGLGELLIVDVSNGRQIRSIPFARSFVSALWSPDGSLYLSQVDALLGRAGQRMLRLASISSPRPIEQPEDFTSYDIPAISPDGEWVATWKSTSPATLRSLRDPKALPMTIPGALGADFSPDGRWLAFTAYGPVNKIVVIPLPYDGQRQFEVAADEGDQPRWFPDGRRLAYKRGRQFMVIDLTFRGDQMDAAPPKVFAEGPFPYLSQASYAIGPDGRVLTFANAADETCGRELKIITNFPELVRQKERRAAK